MPESGRFNGNKIDMDTDLSTRTLDGPTNKQLDANKYATKKTIAQGMLDIALLTANASQLKYVLQLGHRHEFYQVMIVLISSSIVLQVSLGAILLLTGPVRSTSHYGRVSTNTLNHVAVALSLFVVVIDCLKLPFASDIRFDTGQPASGGSP